MTLRFSMKKSLSQGYPCSVFFQPSSSVSPGLSITRPSPGPVLGNASNSVLRLSLSTNFDSTESASSVIGFRGVLSRTHFLLLYPLALQIQSTELNTVLLWYLFLYRILFLLIYWCPPLLVMVAYFPPLVLLPTMYLKATVFLAVLTHSARTILYSERAPSDALMRRGGAFQTEKPWNSLSIALGWVRGRKCWRAGGSREWLDFGVWVVVRVAWEVKEQGRVRVLIKRSWGLIL